MTSMLAIILAIVALVQKKTTEILPYTIDTETKTITLPRLLLTKGPPLLGAITGSSANISTTKVYIPHLSPIKYITQIQDCEILQQRNIACRQPYQHQSRNNIQRIHVLQTAGVNTIKILDYTTPDTLMMCINITGCSSSLVRASFCAEALQTNSSLPFVAFNGSVYCTASDNRLYTISLPCNTSYNCPTSQAPQLTTAPPATTSRNTATSFTTTTTTITTTTSTTTTPVPTIPYILFGISVGLQCGTNYGATGFTGSIIYTRTYNTLYGRDQQPYKMLKMEFAHIRLTGWATINITLSGLALQTSNSSLLWRIPYSELKTTPNCSMIGNMAITLTRIPSQTHEPAASYMIWKTADCTQPQKESTTNIGPFFVTDSMDPLSVNLNDGDAFITLERSQAILSQNIYTRGSCVVPQCNLQPCPFAIVVVSPAFTRFLRVRPSYTLTIAPLNTTSTTITCQPYIQPFTTKFANVPGTNTWSGGNTLCANITAGNIRITETTGAQYTSMGQLGDYNAEDIYDNIRAKIRSDGLQNNPLPPPEYFTVAYDPLYSPEEIDPSGQLRGTLNYQRDNFFGTIVGNNDCNPEYLPLLRQPTNHNNTPIRDFRWPNPGYNYGLTDTYNSQKFDTNRLKGSQPQPYLSNYLNLELFRITPTETITDWSNPPKDNEVVWAKSYISMPLIATIPESTISDTMLTLTIVGYPPIQLTPTLTMTIKDLTPATPVAYKINMKMSRGGGVYKPVMFYGIEIVTFATQVLVPLPVCLVRGKPTGAFITATTVPACTYFYWDSRNIYAPMPNGMTDISPTGSWQFQILHNAAYGILIEAANTVIPGFCLAVPLRIKYTLTILPKVIETEIFIALTYYN